MTCRHTTPSDQPRCGQCGESNPAYTAPPPLTEPEILSHLRQAIALSVQADALLMPVPDASVSDALCALESARKICERAIGRRESQATEKAA
jgi:hypothetical protein